MDAKKLYELFTQANLRSEAEGQAFVNSLSKREYRKLAGYMTIEWAKQLEKNTKKGKVKNGN